MIRRMTEQDAKKAHDFLGKVAEEDPAAGITDVASEEQLEDRLQKGYRTWLAFDGKKIVGILGPRVHGVRTVDGKKRTFHYYRLLAVDPSTYKTSQKDAALIAKDLTLFAADDAEAAGELEDDICAVGPVNSRGSAWCRLLGFEEEQSGGESTFWLESKLIWERCKRVELL